jgi:hypothetical protein
MVVVLTFYAINWVRQDGGFDWNLAHALPLMGGHPVSFYDLAGAGLILYTLSRIIRGGARSEDDPADDDWEYEEDWDDEDTD